MKKERIHLEYKGIKPIKASNGISIEFSGYSLRERISFLFNIFLAVALNQKDRKVKVKKITIWGGLRLND